MTSATAAAIIGLDRKAFDNLVGRLDLQEIPRGRQGIERRIPVSLLPQLYLAAEFSGRIGVPIREAFAIARALMNGEQPVAPFVHIAVDLDRLRQEIDDQLVTAVEMVVRRPRGRPPKAPA